MGHRLLASAIDLVTDRQAWRFVAKGLLSLSLALLLADLMALDRPYWALISAVFLQIRPETGLVVEKGLCLITGTLIGGLAALAMSTLVPPEPAYAVALLTPWVGLNAAASVWVRRANFIYGFAMAAVTATLVLLLPVIEAAQGPSGIIAVAQARITEIVLGATCATLVSTLVWPTRVSTLLTRHARLALNQTMDYLERQLSADSSHAQRHQRTDRLLQTVLALNDDSSAAHYEGRRGPARAWAASQLCLKTLSLMARAQVLGRLRRNHPQKMTPVLGQLYALLYEAFRAMRETRSVDNARHLNQKLRHDVRALQSQHPEGPPVQQRFLQVAQRLCGDLVVALIAYRSLLHNRQTLLRAPALKPYRDRWNTFLVGTRTTLIFFAGGTLWVLSERPEAVQMMIMPVLLSIMTARMPNPDVRLRKSCAGAVLATATAAGVSAPVVQSLPGSWPSLLAAGAPLVPGIALIHRPGTLPFGLGFCAAYIILVRPGTGLIGGTADLVMQGLGMSAGLFIGYLMFRLIAPPGSDALRRRLISEITRDLATLADQPQGRAETRFMARMAERLRRLTECDAALPPARRYYGPLGLTALNLGQVSLWLHGRLALCDAAALVEARHRWQHALAHAFEQSANGARYPEFRQAGATLIALMREQPGLDATTLSTIEGAQERLALTLERIADRLQPSR